MTLEETRKRILEDDEFVLSEMDKIRYVYRLKKEIRWARNRNENEDTESVAEHIYGMHILANYFLALEDVNSEWDKTKILETITWHDLDEVETGDTISHQKTSVHHKESKAAWPKVFDSVPHILKERIQFLMNEYTAESTIEAKFVEAIDKLEPIFEEQDESYKDILSNNGNTLERHWAPRRKYLEPFPFIWRFAIVGTDRITKKGYFASEA